MREKKKIYQWAKKQYKNSNRLLDRIQIWQYGDNPLSIHEWIFYYINFHSHDSILELGCGTGKLWLDNISHIPKEPKKEGEKIILIFAGRFVEKKGLIYALSY